MAIFSYKAIAIHSFDGHGSSEVFVSNCNKKDFMRMNFISTDFMIINVLLYLVLSAYPILSISFSHYSLFLSVIRLYRPRYISCGRILQWNNQSLDGYRCHCMKIALAHSLLVRWLQCFIVHLYCEQRDIKNHRKPIIIPINLGR